MKITNDHNLPKAFQYAAQRLDADYAQARGNAHFTVTELCAPEQLVLLRRRHAQELTEDVSDTIWAIFGSAVHLVLAKAAEVVPDEITERRLSAELPINGEQIRISGAFDSLRMESGVLSDYKVTSTFAIEDGVKQEWIEQLNMLSWLLEHNTGQVPRRLSVVALLRDQLNARTVQSAYPQYPVAEFDVALWDSSETHAMIEERLETLLAAQPQPDHKLPECNAVQRWSKPDVWAVKRRGAERALRGGLHASLEDATAMAVQYARAHKLKREALHIEHRAGKETRCERFCPVREICQQRQRALANEDAA